MGDRGRRSAASLSVVGGTASIPIGEAVKPPKGLTEAEREIWETVSGDKSADWWDEGNAPLLADYCRHIVRQDLLSKMIAEFTPTPENFSDYDALLRASDRETSAIVRLATKMRLSQQARYTTQAAGTAARKGSGKKLWES